MTAVVMSVSVLVVAWQLAPSSPPLRAAGERIMKMLISVTPRAAAPATQAGNRSASTPVDEAGASMSTWTA